MAHMPRIQFHILTLFPELFTGILNSSLLAKASAKGLVSFNLTQIRDFATDKHKTVDDTPFGGGEGMLLKADVLYRAWRSVVPEKSCAEAPSGSGLSSAKTITILLSPQGELFDQKMAHELTSTYSKIVLVCGHYEGVDERFIDLCVDREVSIGNYILTGGELPAAVLVETMTRLVPGVVGNERSLTEESLERDGLLKYPQYTRPREFKDHTVPDVLLAGDHKAIQTWREQEMRRRTERKRPDLLK